MYSNRSRETHDNRTVPFTLLLLSTSLLVPACVGDEVDLSSEQQELQCGDTLDFQDVETYDGTYGVSKQFVADHETPVGKASVGCSGTLVAPNIFLSAGHCNYEENGSVRFNYQLDGDTGRVRPGDTFYIVEVIAQKESYSNDYAIVRLDGDPGDIYSFGTMSKRNPDDADHLTIIGHPDGWPKKVSVGDPAGDLINGGFFKHHVDTLPGNSGSGVLNELGYLVGVHTGGGCDNIWPFDYNEGMRMAAILDDSAALRNIRNGSGSLRIRLHASNGWGFDKDTVLQSHISRVWADQRWVSGDFDGDGAVDVASIYGDASGTARVWVHRNTGTGYAYKASFTTLAGFSLSQRWLVGDFNGDGKDDLVNVYGKSGTARAWVHLSTGSGFQYKSSFTTLAGFSSSQRWLVGDFNGDGKDDLVNVYDNSGTARAWVHLSTGSGFQYKSSYTTLAAFYSGERWMTGDFDGDGKDDLVNVYGNSAGSARAWVHRSTGSGFQYQTSLTTLAGFSESQTWLATDVDEDGRDDLVNIYPNGANRTRAWVHRSTGSGFQFKSSLQTLAPAFPGTRWLASGPDLVQIHADGDGD